MFNVIRELLGMEDPPTKILEVKVDTYSTREKLDHQDVIVLYAPSADRKEAKYYEIVLHSPSDSSKQCYSIFRTVEQPEAETRFVYLKDRLPTFIDASKEMCNLNGIQKICDALNEHPSWTLAHLAAYLGCHDSFTSQLIVSHLNAADGTGMSPLQVAITTCNVKAVQALVAAKSSLEHLDNNANSVYHYAAGTNKEIIMALSEAASHHLNARNRNGHTPLHMACLADKPDCVKALLLAGADVNITASKEYHLLGSSRESSPGNVSEFLQDNSNKLHAQDMKFGGTPLHWCSSREVIESLVGMGCNIDALNFDGRTALHVMVLRNRIECVVALLSREANLSIGDYQGNTPLHLACLEGFLPIVQCLIIFGANLDTKNDIGATPRHLLKGSGSTSDKILYILHSVGAERCSPDMDGCSECCKYNGGFNGVAPPAPPSIEDRTIINELLTAAVLDENNSVEKGKKGGRVLCLDGGGIRGLILVQLLLEIERIIKKPVIDCFDWLAGTSTGGILALTLASGKTMQECLCLYFRLKECTFVGGRPYPSEALENILKETLGTTTVMADIQRPKIMITGVLADRKPVDLHLFRNYTSPSDILGAVSRSSFEPTPPPSEQLVWKAARATGAAPSYFRSFERFLDGGLIANNPTQDALTEIYEYNLALRSVGRGDEAKPISLVISLGTGRIPLEQLESVDVFRPESLWDTAKLAKGISALGAVLVDQATLSDGRVIDRLRAWCSMIGAPFYRFSPQMSEDIAMDEKNDEKLVNMLWETKAYMYKQSTALQEVAALLNNE